MHKPVRQILVLLFVSLVFIAPAQAGIVSSILKSAGKAGKKLDLDADVIKKLDFNLPDTSDAYVVTAKVNQDGNWILKGPDGRRLPMVHKNGVFVVKMRVADKVKTMVHGVTVAPVDVSPVEANPVENEAEDDGDGRVPPEAEGGLRDDELPDGAQPVGEDEGASFLHRGRLHTIQLAEE